MSQEPRAEDELSVLMIEADDAEAKRLLSLFQEENLKRMSLSRSSNLSEGLETIGKEAPQIVLLNLMQPDSGGIHSLRKLIQQSPEVPIVVINGPDDPELALSVFREGAQDYLTKSEIGSRRLSTSITYALARANFSKSKLIFTREALQNKSLAALAEVSSDASNHMSGSIEQIESALTALRTMMSSQTQKDPKLSSEALEFLSTTREANQDLKSLAIELDSYASDFEDEIRKANELRKAYRILVVEDEVEVGSAIVRRLSKLGFHKIDYARNGREAYNICVNSVHQGPRVAAVISDWKMPDWTGEDLLEHLRKNVYFQDIAFLMVSAVDKTSQIQELGGHKINGYLLKPFTSFEFDRKIKEILFQI